LLPQQKMLPKCFPTIKENFCLENVFQKVFLMSLLTLVTGGTFLGYTKKKYTSTFVVIAPLFRLVQKKSVCLKKWVSLV